MAMEMFLDSPSPELARLILESEYDTILHCEQISTEIVIGLQLIKELAWHIHYDEDCIAIYYQPKIYGGILPLNMLPEHFIQIYRKM